VVVLQTEFAVAVGQDLILRVVQFQFRQQRAGNGGEGLRVVVTVAENDRPGLAGVVSVAVCPDTMPTALDSGTRT